MAQKQVNNKSVYLLSGVDPKTIEPSSRIEFDHNRILKTDDGQSLPPFVEESNFRNSWDHSIPLGMSIYSDLSLEDRGEWEDL